MTHIRPRIRQRRIAATLVTGAGTLIFCALANVTAAGAATPPHATTAPSTTAPAVLPTSTNPALPHSGMDSAQLAELGLSAILIGVGACSLSRGARVVNGTVSAR